MKGGAPAKTARASAKPAAAPSRPTSKPEPKGAPAAGAKSAAPAGAASAASKSAKPAATSTPPARSAPRPAKPGKGKSLSEDDLFGDDLDFDSPSSPAVSATTPTDDGDDPLEVKSTAGKDAIPASRQRTKSRPQKVTCPMCETVGYIPANAAGKDVRCANPKCLVPVFVAPRAQKKTEDAKSSKSKSQTIGVIFIVLLFFLAAGGAWYVYNLPRSTTPKAEPAKPYWKTPTDAPIAGAQGDQPGPGEAPQLPDAQLTLAAERDPILEHMEQDAASRDRNLRPPYCRRVVAQTAADCGKLELAQKYVEQLPQGKSDLAFYQIAPLTSIAWQQLKKGDQAAAGKSLDQAMAATGGLPTMGRDSVDFSATLAAALVAVGRDQEAKTLVTRYPASGPNGRLMALMTTGAAWKTWDIVEAESERPLFDLSSLQCPVVVELAVAQGYPSQALHFTESIENPSERSQTLIAWAQAVARAQAQAKSADLSSVEPVAVKLDPPNRARLQARLGTERLRAKDRPGAEKFLAAAVASLGEIPPPKEFVIPPIKKLATFQFHDPAQARLNSLALAEIARLEGALDKQADAQKHLELAIAGLRASAPNKIAAKQRVEDAGQLRSSAFEEPVPTKGRKEAIALAKRRNQERSQAALEKVRQMSKLLAAAADSRFDLQTQIVASALAWDDPGHIWQIIGGPATSADVDQKEPYFETAIPLQLVIRLRHSGDKATAEKIESQSSSEPPTETVVDLMAQRATEIDDADSLAREMQKLRTGTGERAKLERSDLERATLAASSRLLHAGKVAKAIQFVRMFNDSQLKEEALEWTTALACRLNHTGETKEILKTASSSFIPTESVSAYRGFLMGLLARDLAPEAAAPATPSQPNAAATSQPDPAAPNQPQPAGAAPKP
jgi:hypothetical protein